MTVHVVIVGAAGGIGRAVALSQAAEGRRLSLIDIDQAGLQQIAALTRARGAAVSTLEIDVSTPQGAAECADRLEAIGPAIDRFVHSAGITGPVAPIDEYPWNAFELTMRINVHGPFLILQRLIPLMRLGHQPAAVLLGSTSSLRGRAALSGYVASKHALLGLVRSVALDLADDPVRINAVLPGPVDTQLLRVLEEAATTSGLSMGRSASPALTARPDDVADSVDFLLSDRARHIRGAALVLDGGMTLA